jgi:hypothetical protein
MKKALQQIGRKYPLATPQTFRTKKSAVHLHKKLNDRYQTIKGIGTSGLADIYKGYDTSLERYVTLKIDKDGRYKLTDFSILWIDSTLSPTLSQDELEAAFYCSPEYAKGEKVSFQSDLYSLGIVLFRLVTGHLPFEGNDVDTIFSKHINESPPHPKEFNPNIPDILCQVILKSLGKNPDDRYQSPTQMKSFLSQSSLF